MSKALHILQHSLGVDQYGRGEKFRNHFCTGEGSADYAVCMDLVERGLMTRRNGSYLTGGDYLFMVTDAGRKFVANNSRSPPKTTRAQRRYSAYLGSDTSLSFIGWMRSYGKEVA